MNFLRDFLVRFLRINRYIVGCKYRNAREHTRRNPRINRYIVGCKCKTSTVKGVKENRINRYIVECKFVRFFPGYTQLLELIDT